MFSGNTSQTVCAIYNQQELDTNSIEAPIFQSPVTKRIPAKMKSLS